VVESLLPVMRELGLVSIFWDVNVSSAGKAFDVDGELLDQALPRRINKMLDELVWMARVMRSGRERVSSADGTQMAMACAACGAAMNQHATKVDYSAAQQLPGEADPTFHGVVQEVHQCPDCGNVELRAQAEVAAPAARR
jgi:predicted RNA-binding Zn-ribbon protein involved in translation (DUF1610 family)